jgi:lysophospholipase L1-like esterase
MHWNPLKIVLALVLGLVLAEGALWGAHVAFGNQSRASGGAADILCIGDSHTFGWNVDADSTYPAQLERLLVADGLDVGVTNRGAAGKNTATLLEELDEYLAADGPRIVLILAGINNPWSRPREVQGDQAPTAMDQVRVVKLVRILWSRVAGESRVQGTGDGQGAGSLEETELENGRTQVRVVTREGNVETFEVGGGHLSHAEAEVAYEWIKRDLGTLAERVRAFGATPVLLTYAVENGPTVVSVNYTIRDAAKEHGIALIDVAKAIEPELATWTPQRLIFPDAHPRREGYSVIARILHDGLVQAGLIQAAPLGDPFLPLRDVAVPVPKLAATPDDNGGWSFDLTFEPILDYSLVLSSALAPADSPSLWLKLPVGLAQNELFKSAANDEALRGSFDPQGQAQVRLTATQVESLGASSGPLYAQLIARTSGWTLLAASEVVQLR